MSLLVFVLKDLTLSTFLTTDAALVKSLLLATFDFGDIKGPRLNLVNASATFRAEDAVDDLSGVEAPAEEKSQDRDWVRFLL